MSAINTNGINSNYPVPGVNNNSQGFRDNFASLKNSLDTASIEITDIQNKAIVKSGLTGINLNNDMANTLISNALVKSFRATTYNLGSNLSGKQKVNVNLADVHYGTITGDTTIEFGGWAPSGTQSNVQLVFTIADSAVSSVITLPQTTLTNSIRTAGMTDSARLLENYSSIPAASSNVTNTLTIPAGVNQLHYVISTLDCGTTMEIVPVNRNQRASQVVLAGTPTVANVIASGTIVTSDETAIVTGTDTQFLSELRTVNGLPGRVILDSTDTVIGTVLSVESDNSLTLEENSKLKFETGVTFKRQLPTGDNTDVLGAVKVDADYVYICTANFDGANSIWKRISPNAY